MHQSVASIVNDVDYRHRCVLIEEANQPDFVSVLYDLERFLSDLFNFLIVKSCLPQFLKRLELLSVLLVEELLIYLDLGYFTSLVFD